MTNNPAIVVAAYNRAFPLFRLLNSINRAVFNFGAVTLVISIDQSDSNEVLKLAKNFEWKFGEKKIIQHKEHLGLKAHILACGKLTEQFDSIILLEDDLLVSPYFYEYAKLTLDFYKNEPSIAGVSLYNYEVAESCFFPFRAIDDGSDVYFMQVASSWGQLWTKQQWLGFSAWLNENSELTETTELPDYLYEWGSNSWKKHFIHYLIATNKYFVFPRLSLTTNFEEPGTNATTKGVFQVTLQFSERKYNFKNFNESRAKYDAWFEITPESLQQFYSTLKNYDYTTDLYSSKKTDRLKPEFILTSKQSINPIKSFSSSLFPLETNIIADLKGNSIGLYPINSKFEDKLPSLINLLEKENRSNNPAISVIIPLLEYSENLVKNTLDSITNQQYFGIEIIIVTDKEYRENVEKLLSYASVKTKIVIDHLVSKDACIESGFKQATGQIFCWIEQGTVLENKCFAKVASIFKVNQSVNWIRGIDETCHNAEEYSKIRTLKYRLVPGEAYKRLIKNKLDYSLELHFFNRRCFYEHQSGNFSQHHFFFNLITNFELNVVVNKFGQKIHVRSEKLENFTKTKLLEQLLPFQHKTRVSSKFLDLLIRTPFFNDGSWQWYFPSLHNFPDVLRYDPKNGSFFFCKY